ncbi:glycoside hydrolase [Botrimarina sp.]|uniref:glycoside hydrolase n=1 Tax=Botrimarina sp. TaxID=2795802 RepID=UPI0032EC419E
MRQSRVHTFEPLLCLAAAVAVLHVAGDATASPATPPGASLMDDPGAWQALGCRVEPLEGGGMRLVEMTPHAVLQRPIDAPAGGAVIEFDLRADLPDGEHYVSWTAEGGRPWSDFVRVPVIVDGQWRRYRLPLAGAGRTAAIRIALSGDADSLAELRKVRVTAVGAKADAPTAVREATAGPLRLVFDPNDRRFVVHDQRTGRQWRSDPLDPWAAIQDSKADENGRLTLDLVSRFSERPLTLRATVTPDGAVRFQVAPSSPDDPIEGLERLAPRFTTALENGKLVFCDRSCGVLLDQRDTAYSGWPLRVWGNTHCLDMPWIGLYDRRRGDGVMTLFETPADAEVSLLPDADGRCWPQPRWLACRDRFAYERSVVYRFVPDGAYVAIAKAYRELLKADGRLTTLAQKAQQRPPVQRLPGAAIIWTADEYIDQLDAARSLGVRRGVVSGVQRRRHVAELKEAGFLVGRYDSYSDIFQGATGFQRDDIPRAAVRSRPGADPLNGWTMDDGRQMAWRSTAFWMAAAMSYTPQQLARSGHNARFIDVAVAAKAFENWAPGHDYDRRRDIELRRELLQYINGFGVEVGAEHGNDWAADLVDHHEGALSGPFWWSSWDAGRLQPPTADQLSEAYKKFGAGFAHRVPLWQLVFQDCMVSTWYWGDTPGMLHHADERIADHKDLITILYGGAPLLWLSDPGRGYDWRENRWRWLRTYHDTTPLHERVAFSQMTSHRFLSEDGAVQQTRFANGAVATVNFGDTPAIDPDDPDTTLAPDGYRVRAPGLRQQRLWIDGGACLELESDGLLIVDAPREREALGVRHTGRVTMFRDDQGAWTAMGEPGAQAAIDLSRVAGWPPGQAVRKTPIAAVHPGADATDIRVGEPIELPAADTGWAYRFEPVDNPKPAAQTGPATAP